MSDLARGAEGGLAPPREGGNTVDGWLTSQSSSFRVSAQPQPGVPAVRLMGAQLLVPCCHRLNLARIFEVRAASAAVF